jgi:hypothetical protein
MNENEDNENNPLTVLPSDIDTPDIKKDFNIARDNIQYTIDVAKTAISDMLDIAKSAQHPAAYDVLGTLIKNTSQLSKDMMEIYKKKVDIDTIKNVDYTNNEDNPSIVNNNLFVGSTAELQALIENSRKLKEVVVIKKETD